MPGITVEDEIESTGDKTDVLINVVEGVSLVSSLIFFTVLLFNEPLVDLIKFDDRFRCSKDSSVWISVDIWCLFERCNCKYSLDWNFFPQRWQVLIWDFPPIEDVDGVVPETIADVAEEVELLATDANWFAKAWATSDATLRSEGGNWDLLNAAVFIDDDDEDSLELSV